MTRHYKNSPPSRLKKIIDRAQINNQGSFLEYVRREKEFIEKREIQRELGRQRELKK